MKRTPTYFVDGREDREISSAWSVRISGRTELCFGWYRGPLPSFFWLIPAGRLHPGAVSSTLRVWRIMLGIRRYS